MGNLEQSVENLVSFYQGGESYRPQIETFCRTFLVDVLQREDLVLRPEEILETYADSLDVLELGRDLEKKYNFDWEFEAENRDRGLSSYPIGDILTSFLEEYKKAHE